MTIISKEKDIAPVDFLPPHTYAHCVQDYQIQTLFIHPSCSILHCLHVGKDNTLRSQRSRFRKQRYLGLHYCFYSGSRDYV